MYFMGLIVSLPKFVCWIPNPQYFWQYLEIEPLKRDEVKMRLLVWALIQSE